jgi:hypothetical protein
MHYHLVQIEGGGSKFVQGGPFRRKETSRSKAGYATALMMRSEVAYQTT